ncbi:MAG: sulfotransferase family protein [Zetaproteobacteria bacterium]|nr:MAG: sulfotransferase family protein [Zetaproteobacteria bacterium]
MRSRLSNNRKRKIRLLLEQATQLLERGQHQMCERICQNIEHLDPGNADAANLRGLMTSAQGRPEQALHWFSKATEAEPRRAEFHANLAGMLLLAQKSQEALKHYQQALRLQPRLPSAKLGMATALVQLRRYDEAIQLLEALQRKKPSNHDILMRLFRAHYHAGHTEQAETWLRKALDLKQDDADGWYQLGLLLLENGKRSQGRDALLRALQFEPDHADAALLLADTRRFDTSGDEAALIESMYRRADEGSEQRMKLAFAYAKVLDDLDRTEESFACIREANEIRHRHSSYDQETELAHLEAIMNAYDEETIGHACDLEDQTPIFIVGMPRCGSTLVEQILAAHPDVLPRGETGLMEETFLRLGEQQKNPVTLQDIQRFSPEQWRAIGESYVASLRAGDDTPRLTDKTLSNIRFIGAIYCALPHARIIHVRRNPMDTCWSIHRHHLLGPLFDFGSSLGELGYYYRMYQRLMDHWHRVLPQGTMYEMDYEDLVTDPEGEIRKLLEACNLDWNERCLRFHEAKTSVRTASFMQVRRPITPNAIGAWKRYAAHLQPLLRILGEAGAD